MADTLSHITNGRFGPRAIRQPARPTPINDSDMGGPLDPLDLWLRLARCASGVQKEIAKQLKSEFNTSPIRVQVLAALARGDAGLSMVELSQTLGLTQGAMTKPVRALEAEGLLTVEFDPCDRRYRMLSITDSGCEWLSRLTLSNREWMECMFVELSGEQSRQLFRLLGAVKSSNGRAKLKPPQGSSFRSTQ